MIAPHPRESLSNRQYVRRASSPARFHEQDVGDHGLQRRDLEAGPRRRLSQSGGGGIPVGRISRGELKNVDAAVVCLPTSRLLTRMKG